MATVVIDYESAYCTASKYSLGSRDMTTEAYVRDERFETIMLGVHIPSEGESYWIPNYREAVAKELDGLELHKHQVIAHNNKFDGFVSYDRYGVEFGEYACTLAMARPLHGARDANSLAKLAKRYGLEDKGQEVVMANGKWLRDFTKAELKAYGDYCIKDCRISYRLFEIFRDFYSARDLVTISDTIRAHCVPRFKVDVPLLEEYIPRLEKEQEKKLQDVAELLGYSSTELLAKDLRSNPKFAKLLEELGYEIPYKDSKTAKNEDGTPKKTFAFAKNDIAFKNMLDSEDEELALLCKARIGEKSTINLTRAQRFIEIGKRGRMPFSLEPLNATTTRWTAGSGDKTNQQNLSKRQGDKTLRRSMKAPNKKWCVAACDLSQIEARYMAAVSGQEDLRQGFLEGRDVYCEMATEIYNELITKKDETERSVGKETILAAQFGLWFPTFRTRLRTGYGIKVSEDFAKHTILTYRDKMDCIVEYWKECEQAIETMLSGGQYWFGRERNYLAEKGSITLPDGWKMVYEDLQVEGEDDFGRPYITYIDRVKRSRRRINKGIVANNTVQGGAARIMQWQLSKIRQYGFHMAGTVHDELIFVEPREDLEELHDIVTHYMRRVPKWAKRTPVDCEFTAGPNYADQDENWRRFIL